MNTIQQLLFKEFAGSALLRPCLTRIPRSGKEGGEVNCFSLSIEVPGGQAWQIASLTHDSVNCTRIDESGKRIDTTLQMQHVAAKSIRVTHFDGLAEIHYFGLWDFVLGRATRWPYLQIFADRVGQWVFNKRKLSSAQQMDVLAALAASADVGVDVPVRARGLSKFAVAQSLAGRRYWLHPNAGAHRARVQLYLDSFVTQEWAVRRRHDLDEYFITGAGLAELERREEDDRKHRANARLQWALWVVALMSAGSAVVQAQILKVPTLIDWSARSGQAAITSPETAPTVQAGSPPASALQAVQAPKAAAASSAASTVAETERPDAVSAPAGGTKTIGDPNESDPERVAAKRERTSP